MNNIKWPKMNKLKPLIEFRFFILTGIGVLTFSNFIIELFGQTIPNIVGAFFKDVGLMVIVAAVVVFDIFGNKSNIEGIRTEFKIHDVAWSYMKQYKTLYPLYNFALVSDNPKSEKKTIFRYI